MAKKVKKEKTILDKLHMNFKKSLLVNIILQALFLVFGVFVYMNPYITATLVGIIIGIYFIIFGLFDLLEFFMRKDVPIFSFKIFLGALAIILGIFIIVNPFKFISILTLALGIYFIIISIFKLIDAIKLKKYGFDGWLLMLITSILLIIFGVIIIINPLSTLDIVEASGIFIILFSILEICNLVMVYSKEKEVVKLLKK